jgi:DNA-binding HxlR family transcriptional regulator
MTDLAQRSRAMFERYTRYGPDDCPIRSALELVAEDKWKLVVLLELARHGERKFGELRRAIPGIRTKALTKSLRALEKGGLLDREVILGIPTRVSYRLTERAHLAIPILLQLQEWLVATAAHSGAGEAASA